MNEREELLARVDERLADLAEANALYGKDQRLNAPDKIARNDREVSWLKDLRSMIVLAHAQACMTCGGRGEIGGFVSADSGYQTDRCPDCAQRVGHCGELTQESLAKATKGKAGTAVGLPHVRGSTTGTGLRVGATDAVQSATSEIMDVTAGETAPKFDQPVAWVVFAENGNVRLWGADRAGPQAFADAKGLICEPVYRQPSEAAINCGRFVRWALQEGPWEGGDLDGGSVQDMAESLGLIVSVPYDPEKHGVYNNCGCDAGDPWFEFSPGLNSVRASPLSSTGGGTAA